MIKEINGDIFTANCQVLVNPVNTQGVMGAGLAKEFKIQFPGYAAWWKDFCENCDEDLAGGDVVLTEERFTCGECKIWIASFATKEHWRNPSQLEWIDKGLQSLATQLREKNLESVALPRLGCGLGGLKWKDVKPLVEKHLCDIPHVEIYWK